MDLLSNYRHGAYLFTINQGKQMAKTKMPYNPSNFTLLVNGAVFLFEIVQKTPCGSWLAPGHLMVGRYPMLQKSKVGFASICAIGSINSLYFHIIGDKLINPIP